MRIIDSNYMYSYQIIKSLRQRKKDRISFLSNKKLFGSSSHLVVTLIVLFACLVASAYYWVSVRSSVEDNFSKDAESTIATAEQAIGSRLQIYEDIMTGGVGLFNSSDDVTRNEWKSFISAFNVAEKYPGIQGFGYVAHVQAEDIDNFVQEVRATDIAEYSVEKTATNDPYAPLLYVEPLNDLRRSLLGLNMMTDSNRRQAIEYARDSGEMSVTGKVILIQARDGSADNQEAGIVLYMPVYRKGVPTSTVEERQRAIKGYIYSALRVNELMNGVFGENGNPNLALQLYGTENKDEENLMYRSDNFSTISNQKGILFSERTLDVNENKWIISYAVSPKALSSSDRNAPWFTLLRGILISIAVAGLVYYLLTNRTRKLIRAQRFEVQTAKDDLLSLASHQLRTPATVVKQYVGMLLQGYAGDLTPQQKEMLDNAYISNERQLQIINQILYVARLDAGQLKLQKEYFDIAKLLRDITKEHETIIRESNQKLIKQIPKKKIEILADPRYLSMAIDNLINNAHKYTPDGGTINISLTKKDNKVAIKITDTGIGISEDEAEHIFDKFTRGSNEMIAESSGSGIGLYLVKQIAELHKGRIIAKSIKPNGSAFTLTLPIKAIRQSSSKD